MSKKLFVGGLSWSTNDAGLRSAFERYGDIQEAKVIMDRETGRSRGFGFVTFSEADDATKAINALNGAMIDGRAIKVNEANEKPEGERGPRGPRPSFGGGPRR